MQPYIGSTSRRAQSEQLCEDSNNKQHNFNTIAIGARAGYTRKRRVRKLWHYVINRAGNGKETGRMKMKWKRQIAVVLTVLLIGMQLGDVAFVAAASEPMQKSEESAGTPAPTQKPEEGATTSTPTQKPEESATAPAPSLKPEESAGTPTPTQKPEEGDATSTPSLQPEDSMASSAPSLEPGENAAVSDPPKESGTEGASSAPPIAQEKLGGVCICDSKCDALHINADCEACQGCADEPDEAMRQQQLNLFCTGVEDSGALECVCVKKCTSVADPDTLANMLICPVCGDHSELCEGEEMECTCSQLCDSGYLDSSCLVCARTDLAYLALYCKGTDTCICEENGVICGKDYVYSDCKVCMANPELCLNQCICDEEGIKCTSKNVDVNGFNPESQELCWVCIGNPDYCKGKLVCFCSFECVGDAMDPDCPVCPDVIEENRPYYCEGGFQCAADMIVLLEKQPDKHIWISDDVNMEQTVEITGNVTVQTLGFNGQDKRFSLNRTMDNINRPVFYVKKGATLTLNSIIISGSSNYLTSYAPLIQVEEGGALILQDCATLCENQNIRGAGGAVACYGGMVRLEAGAEILKNEASDGAGIYLGEAAQLWMQGDAKINGNNAQAYGGGVYSERDCAVSLSGTPMIDGNFADGEKSNLYIEEGMAPLSLGEGLEIGAAIGISMDVSGVFAVKDSDVIKEDIQAFQSDEGYYVSADGKTLLLTEGDSSFIAGRVLFEGNPVQYADVILKDKESGRQIAKYSTDKEGTYKINIKLMDVPLRVIASADLEERYSAYQDITLGEGKITQAPELNLTRGQCLSGKVIGDCRQDVTIIAKDKEGTQTGQTITYGDGWFEIMVSEDCYIQGEGRILGEQYTGSLFVDEKNLSAIQELSLKKGGLVSGYVVDSDGVAVEGAVVAFYKENMVRAAKENVQDSLVASSITDKNGRFEASGLLEGGIYQAAAFAKEREAAVSCKVQVSDQQEILLLTGEEKSAIVLEKGIEVTGCATNFYQYFIFDEESRIYEDRSFPKNLLLKLCLEDGTVVAESPVSEYDGSFSFPALLAGNYVLVLAAANDEKVQLSSEGAYFGVSENGKIVDVCPNQGGNDLFQLMLGNWEPEDEIFSRFPEDNVICLHTSAVNEAFLQILEFIISKESFVFDAVPEADKDEWIKKHLVKMNKLNACLKEIHSLELDMLPEDLSGNIAKWMEYLAAKYKIMVSVKNHADSVLERLHTNLKEGNGENISNVAKRIAVRVGNQYDLLEKDTEIELILKAEPAKSRGIRAIQDSHISGEVLQYFDIGLTAELRSNFSTKDKTASDIISEKIEETGENIEVTISLKSFAYDPEKEYVIVRSHLKNGQYQIDLLTPDIDEAGNITFITDRFSTYAIAYARPGKGIVIETAGDHTPDGGGDADDGENGDGSNNGNHDGGNDESSGGDSDSSGGGSSGGNSGSGGNNGSGDNSGSGGNNGSGGGSSSGSNSSGDGAVDTGSGADGSNTDGGSAGNGGIGGSDADFSRGSNNGNGSKKKKIGYAMGAGDGTGSQAGKKSSGNHGEETVNYEKDNGLELSGGSSANTLVIPDDNVTSVIASKRYQGDSYDSQYAFWLSVRENILRTAAYGVVQIDCKDYKTVPSMVIEALSGKEVTLVISHDGGEDIVIFGKYLTAEKGVTHYSIKMLIELAKKHPVQEGEAYVLSYDADTERGQQPGVMKESDLLQAVRFSNGKNRFVIIMFMSLFIFASGVPLLAFKVKRFRRRMIGGL